VLLACLLAPAFFLLAARLDLSERLGRALLDQEHWQLDELALSLLLLALALAALLLGGFLLSALHLIPGPLAWSVLRATGIVAYLALAVTVTFGALLGSRFSPAWLARAQQYGWHGLLSGFAFVMGSMHGLFLAVDGKYAQPLSALLLPGTSSFAPLPVGLGTLGLYGLALVYLSTRWRKRLSQKVWRGLHLVAYPAFGALTLHGAATGSDHLELMYGAAVTAVLFTSVCA